MKIFLMRVVNYEGSTLFLPLLIMLGVIFIPVMASCFQVQIAGAKTKSEASNARKENAVIPGDFADPSIIRIGDLYYSVGTSSEWAPHFPIFQSTDMLHWKQVGYAFSQTPSWAAASFWAPEILCRNGTCYLYYVARKKSDGISCIGVATSKDPSKGFTDHGILLEFGREAIDPFVIEDNGELYITWKAYGLDKRPIEILGSHLSDNGLKVEGEPFTLLRDDEKIGLEGQCLVKRKEYYYLFYSSGNCCGPGCSYKLELARSASLQGPYIKFAGNPILSQTNEWKCTGHGTIVSSKEGKDFFLYHAYNKTADVFTGRQAMLAELLWNAKTGWPTIKPLGYGVGMKKDFRDDFPNSYLSAAWQWDFRHANPITKITNGNLYLSGESHIANTSGTALTIRPLTGDYEVITEVVNQNTALKGIVLYGDDDRSVGIGVEQHSIQVWEVKQGKRSVLLEEAFKGKQPVYFKMKVEAGYQCRFYWSTNGKNWKQMKTETDYFNGDFLPPWDRSPRPGLLHKGQKNQPAIFSFFQIMYR